MIQEEYSVQITVLIGALMIMRSISVRPRVNLKTCVAKPTFFLGFPVSSLEQNSQMQKKLFTNPLTIVFLKQSLYAASYLYRQYVEIFCQIDW